MLRDDHLYGFEYGFDVMHVFIDDDGEVWDNPYDHSTYYSLLDELWKEEIAIRTTNSN